jgi:hypothetical protein
MHQFLYAILYMLDAGIIAIIMASIIAIERIFSRVSYSECLKTKIKMKDDSDADAETLRSESVEVGPTLGLGQRRVANQSI